MEHAHIFSLESCKHTVCINIKRRRLPFLKNVLSKCSYSGAVLNCFLDQRHYLGISSCVKPRSFHVRSICDKAKYLSYHPDILCNINLWISKNRRAFMERLKDLFQTLLQCFGTGCLRSEPFFNGSHSLGIVNPRIIAVEIVLNLIQLDRQDRTIPS